MLIWQHLSKLRVSKGGHPKCLLFTCYTALLSACRHGWLLRSWRGDCMENVPWGVKPVLGTQLLPPPQTCQWFGSQIICSSVLIKDGLCELTCLVFQAEKSESEAVCICLRQLSVFTTCSDVHFNWGSFQIWGESQAIVKNSHIFEEKTVEIINSHTTAVKIKHAHSNNLMIESG